MTKEWPGHFSIMANQLVDSTIDTTRVYWRKRYYNATDAEANDPRKWEVVLGERK